MIFQIAGCKMEVDGGAEMLGGLPNFAPFQVADPVPLPSAAAACSVRLGRSLPPCAGEPSFVSAPDGRAIRVWLMPDCCRLSLWMPDGKRVYHLQADRHWRQVETDWGIYAPADFSVLNDLLMLSFIYNAAFAGVVLIHASCVALDGEGVAFIGPSGIGKSTHSGLWLKHIPGTRLLNDDQPALRLCPDGTMMLYGTPWSGKTPCYRNEGVRLRTLFRMEQAAGNEIIRLDGIAAFRMLLGAASLMGRDGISFAAISGTLSKIAGGVPAFLLKNRPEEAAARLSYDAYCRCRASGEIE